MLKGTAYICKCKIYCVHSTNKDSPSAIDRPIFEKVWILLKGLTGNWK